MMLIEQRLMLMVNISIKKNKNNGGLLGMIDYKTWAK